MDCIVHGVAKSWTQLSDFHLHKINWHGLSFPQIPYICLDFKVFELTCRCSVARLCSTLWDPMACSMLGFPVLHHLLDLAQIHVHWVSDVIQPSHPLLPPSPPAFNPSQHQGLFQWVSWWPKYWSFSFSISPSNEYSVLISFGIDWFDLPVVQGTLKESSPAPQFETFFFAQLSF